MDLPWAWESGFCVCSSSSAADGPSGARNGGGTAGTSPSGRGRVGAAGEGEAQFEKIVCRRKKCLVILFYA